MIAGILLGGCATHQAATGSQASPKMSEEFRQILAEMPQDTMVAKQVKNGIVALQANNLSRAAELFQEGLRSHPSDGALHFLNATTYHLQSFTGDAKKLDFAKSGYRTALKFDESNYWAAYLLGHVNFEQRHYAEAQNYFSYGLLYAPTNALLLRSLAVASYYANDPTMSLWAAKKAYAQEPENLEGLRALVFAYAASNAPKKAKHYLSLYASKASNAQHKALVSALELSALKQRVGEWKTYYASNDDTSIFGDSGDFNDAFIETGPLSDSSYNPSTDKPLQSDTTPKNDLKSTPKTTSELDAGLKLPKMTLVDIVILGTEEVRSQSRGINILEGLQTTLSGTMFSYNYVSGKDGVSQRIFSPSFNFLDLEYNLNIFNDSKNKAEVLAKPSLLATEDKPSKFYSGAILHVQLSSNNSDGSMVDVPIGIHLEVTPRFYSDEMVEITVLAERVFLETMSESVGFSAFTETSSVSVDATAILRFGETLVLSGLSEVENTKSKSGVPFLDSVPGVQYLFSKEGETQYKKSVLILLTPREARYMGPEMGKEEMKKALQEEEKERKMHVKDLQKKERIFPSNIDTVLAYLEDSHFYRQFRAGDVRLEGWSDADTFEGALKRILSFLYY
jgi:general secretion pathway protein D